VKTRFKLTCSRLMVAGLAASMWIAAASAHPGHDASITITDLTRRALLVVEGDVESVDSAWNQAGTQITTTVRMRVDSYYKGGDGAEFIEFTLLGGTVGDETFAVLGQPEFEQGERALVFLGPQWRTDVTPVVQMDHGKFEIFADPQEAAVEVVVDAVGVAELKADVIEQIRRTNAGLAPEQTAP